VECDEQGAKIMTNEKDIRAFWREYDKLKAKGV